LRQEREAEAKAVAAEKAVVDYTVFAMVDKTKLKMKAALAAAKAQRRSAEALEEMRASKAHWVNVLLFARKEGWGIPEDQRGWTIPGFDWDLQSGGVAK
jgi:hypothetical protein